MGIERAGTLYLLNSTTVDSGAGIDIRLLSSANGGTNDVTQTCTADNTQDNVERTFDPATAGVTAVADATAVQKKGWGLRLAEDMTPADNTNCDVFMPAQTLTVNIDVAVGWTGTILASPQPTWKVALCRYNLSTDAQTVSATGTLGTTTWNAVTENGTFKTVSIPVTRGSNLAFGGGEVLLLQVGLNTGTLPNPLTGTVTYTFTLRIDNATTRIVWAANGALHQFCLLTGDTVGDGVTTRVLDAAESKTLTGDGVVSRVVDEATVRSLTGDGVVSRMLAGGLSRDLVGDGTVSRTIGGTLARDLVGDGTVTRDGAAVAMSSSVVGDGVLDSSKLVVASKSFDLVGEGTVTEIHPVSAFRTFNLVGDGTIGGDITIPLDDVPTGDCPSDWSPNDGLKSIAGTVLFHEPPNQGNPVDGATVLLIRDSDGLLVATTTTDALGAYSFPRDTNDPYTYHVEVRWTDGGTPQQGLSEGGCAPA